MNAVFVGTGVPGALHWLHMFGYAIHNSQARLWSSDNFEVPDIPMLPRELGDQHYAIRRLGARLSGIAPLLRAGVSI